MKPTEEQKRKLLEWCGFALRCPPEKDQYKRGIWDYPDGLIGDVDLDLNNLFKYAVEGKLKELGYHVTYSIDYDHEMIRRGRLLLHYWSVLIGSHRLMGQGEDKDPALALFWAIWEVINE